VELNPVRARMVSDPAEYPWSSYQRHACGTDRFAWIDIDPCYEALGATREERAARSKAFVSGAIPAGEFRVIREALPRGNSLVAHVLSMK